MRTGGEAIFANLGPSLSRNIRLETLKDLVERPSAGFAIFQAGIV
jgi:hypothetical protein